MNLKRKEQLNLISKNLKFNFYIRLVQRYKNKHKELEIFQKYDIMEIKRPVSKMEYMKTSNFKNYNKKGQNQSLMSKGQQCTPKILQCPLKLEEKRLKDQILLEN